MASTFRAQLARGPLQIRAVAATNTLPSIKKHSDPFAPLTGYDYHGHNGPNFSTNLFHVTVGFGPENEEDIALLNRACDRFALIQERIHCEGDVRRFLDRFLTITTILMLDHLNVAQLSEAGPQQGNTVTTVDTSFLYQDHQIMIAECKRPHRLDLGQWANTNLKNSTTKDRLGKECRM